MPRTPTKEEEKLFSNPRLLSYANDMDFYYANIHESAKISKVIQVFEVALRNHIDEKLKVHYTFGDWLFGYLNFYSLGQVVSEIEREYDNLKSLCQQIKVRATNKNYNSACLQEIIDVVNKNNIKLQSNVPNLQNIQNIKIVFDQVVSEIEREYKSLKALCQQIKELANKDYDLVCLQEIIDVIAKNNINLQFNVLNLRNIKDNKDIKSIFNDICDTVFDSNILTPKEKLRRIFNLISFGKAKYSKKTLRNYGINSIIINTIYNDINIIVNKSTKIGRYTEISDLLQSMLNMPIPINRDIIISRLSFGFWENMTLLDNSKFAVGIIKETSFYDIISNTGLKKEVKKIRELRNRCSHEERIIDKFLYNNGRVYYEWKQETKDAMQAINIVSKTLFGVSDMVKYCDKNVSTYYVRRK